MKYDLAETAFRRALAASEAQPESRDLARFLSELGFLLYFVGRYREAEPYLLRALPLSMRRFMARTTRRPFGFWRG